MAYRLPSESEFSLTRTVGSGSNNALVTVEDDVRQCTICFGDDNDNPNLEWCRPCRCRGTCQWTHKVCILRWIDEKQKKKGLDSIVRCEQCQFPYLIILPAPSYPERFKATVDGMVHLVSPFGAFALGVFGVLHLSFKFGVASSRVAAGYEITDQWIGCTYSPVPVLALTLTPMALLGFGMIRWDDFVVRALRWSWRRACLIARRVAGSKSNSASSTLAVLVDTDPNIASAGDAETAAVVADAPAPETDYSSWIVGSLSLPFVSAFFGEVMFRERDWPTLQKSLAGGLAYILASGAVNVYCKLRSEQRRKNRTIADYGKL